MRPRRPGTIRCTLQSGRFQPSTSGSVLSDSETKWVNKRSTGLHDQAGSQQKRFRSVMPSCERIREYANRAGSTLNPKVEGSNPSRPIENYLEMALSRAAKQAKTARW
jgi:hypothetical protein